ncbi:hypothetical protein PRIPAC_79484 [Pristionchus pacificus]|nr:hypothetical protein PRIPAC_79484 [Pristionchus pacificus]
MLKQFEGLEEKTITSDDYGISTSNMTMQRLNRARVMLRLMMNKLSDSDRVRAGYSFTDIVTECTFAGKTCTSSDFVSFLHPDYGICYSFVSDREITRPGAEQGLRMLMTVNQDSPHFTEFDFLPTTDSSTIRAIIHMPEEYPDFSKNGFKIGASTQAMIAFSKTGKGRLDKPYSECTSPGEEGENYYKNYTYTFNLCQHSCLQRLAWEHCKCVDPLYRKGDEHTYCSTPTESQYTLRIRSIIVHLVLCLVNLTSHTPPPDTEEGRTVCDCKSPCTESALQKTVTYGVYPSAKVRIQLIRCLTSSLQYKVAAGTQEQRGVLLDILGGGRQGDGDEDSDDYDVRLRKRVGEDESLQGTTVISTKSTKSTVGTTPTTKDPLCLPEWLTDNEVLKATDVNALACRASYKSIYNNPNITVIQGYPCLSTKRCKSCVMFTDPLHPIWDWPCSYSDYPSVCKKFNDNSTSSISCSEFFDAFDFIPTGVNVPNITNWNTGALPSATNCDSASASTSTDTCWSQTVCVRNESSHDLTKLKQNPLIDKEFLDYINVDDSMDPCFVQEQALTAARWRLDQNGGNGRRRRSISMSSNSTTDPAVNLTVDKPGFGSCEYANSNFKSAADCIKWYRRNGLMFEMYYETLLVQSYTQGPSYNLVTMLSDVAGHAGLWLGLSVISIVEFIALFFMVINTLIRGDKTIVDGDPIGGEIANREEQSRKKTLQRSPYSIDAN